MREKMERAALREKESNFMKHRGTIADIVRRTVPDINPMPDKYSYDVPLDYSIPESKVPNQRIVSDVAHRFMHTNSRRKLTPEDVEYPKEFEFPLSSIFL